MSILIKSWGFLKAKIKYWLYPVLLIIIFIVILIIIRQNPGLLPFSY